MEIQGQDWLDRCKETLIPHLPITFSHRDPTGCIPGVVIRFVALSVLLRLDRPHKWRVALERGRVPQRLVEWLGVSHLESLAEEARVDWLPYGVWMNALTDGVGQWLIQIRQPRPRAVIRDTIRRVLLHAHAVQDGGIVMGGRYWKRFLRDQAKPLAPRGQSPHICGCEGRTFAPDANKSTTEVRRWSHSSPPSAAVGRN